MDKTAESSIHEVKLQTLLCYVFSYFGRNANCITWMGFGVNSNPLWNSALGIEGANMWILYKQFIDVRISSNLSVYQVA